MAEVEVEVHRWIFDLSSAADDLGPDQAAIDLGLRFEYRVVTSLGSTHYHQGKFGTATDKTAAETWLNAERLYIDSLRNTAPEFRNARISALRIERRIVGAWEAS